MCIYTPTTNVAVFIAVLILSISPLHGSARLLRHGRRNVSTILITDRSAVCLQLGITPGLTTARRCRVGYTSQAVNGDRLQQAFDDGVAVPGMRPSRCLRM